VQPREGALHDPPFATQTGAVFGSTSRNHGLHASSPELAAVLVVVIAAVGEHPVGASTGTAAFSPDRTDGVEQRQQLGDVVAVAAGQCDGQRNAGGVADQMVL
jgi:hypothetical protein